MTKNLLYLLGNLRSSGGKTTSKIPLKEIKEAHLEGQEKNYLRTTQTYVTTYRNAGYFMAEFLYPQDK